MGQLKKGRHIVPPYGNGSTRREQAQPLFQIYFKYLLDIAPAPW